MITGVDVVLIIVGCLLYFIFGIISSYCISALEGEVDRKTVYVTIYGWPILVPFYVYLKIADWIISKFEKFIGGENGK